MPVSIIYLPPGPGGVKQGLDDFLAAGHTMADLLALASPELRPLPDSDAADGPARGLYRETEAGLIWLKPTGEGGVVPVPLTNFSARIVGDVVRDDGSGETQRLFEIEAGLAGRHFRLVLPSSSFAAMGWPLEQMGPSAIVYPGFGISQQARAAIQTLSKDTRERRVFTHTGWRKIGGAYVYLHGGGAIGPDGAIEDVEVDLPGELAGYRLPLPPEGDELREGIRASLRLLKGLTQDIIAVPMFSMVWRAPLGTSDFSGYLVGRTGTFKTSTAALGQSHFGATMGLGNLPASWRSTASFLEALAFAAKDALFTVDDFVPKGGKADADRLHRDADSLLRGQANRQGRGRLRPDATPRPARPPRGLVLATGEDLPRGESLGARIFVVEFRKGDVNMAALTACQADAAAGLYALAMAGYVRWLAARYAEVLARLPDELRELRATAMQPGMHPKTADITANLALGLHYFLGFAAQIGVVAQAEAEALWRRGRSALIEAAAMQAAHIGAAEPADLFVSLVRAAIVSGRAHLSGLDGRAPESPETWGWRWGRGELEPQGRRIGWVDEHGVYLEPSAAYATAAALGEATMEAIAVRPRTLHKRLAERNLLASTDGTRGTHTVRKVIGGVRQEVLHLFPDRLLPSAAADQPGHGAPGGPEGGDGGQFANRPPPLSSGGTDGMNCPLEASEHGADQGTGAAVSLVSSADGEGQEAVTHAGTSDDAAKPAGPCWNCRGTRFWRDQYRVWKCAACHPPADESVVFEWFEVTDQDEGQPDR